MVIEEYKYHVPAVVPKPNYINSNKNKDNHKSKNINKNNTPDKTSKN